MEDIKFSFAELKTISLKEGDVLSVKLTSSSATSEDLESLRKTLGSVFPNNQVLIFDMPEGEDIVFEKVEQEPVLNCSTAPKGYCDDCNCGKKTV
jgi:hypothetical protein